MGMNQDAIVRICSHNQGANIAELYRQMRHADLSQTMIIHLMDLATGLVVSSDQQQDTPVAVAEHKFTAEATTTAPPENTYLPEDAPEQHAPPPTEPEPAPEPEPEPAEQVASAPPEPEAERAVLDPNKKYTRDDIRNAMRPLVAISRDKAKEILEKYGAGNISDLAEEHFPVVMVELHDAVSA